MKTTRTKKYGRVFSAWLWLTPPLAMISLFCLYPAVSAVARSFMDWPLSGAGKWVWFANYRTLFTDNIFWKSSYNMLILVVFGMITANVATLFLAELLFNMRRQRVSKVFRYLFLIPSLVPGMVTILLWKNVVLSGGSGGLMNIIIGLFGAEPNAWYFSESMSKFSFILTGFPWVGGISFLIYLAGLQAIPESCFEAARLDGITTFKRLFYIDLPLLTGQLKYFLIIGVVGGVQAFDLQLIITDGGPNYSTAVPGYLLYLKTYGYSALGEASAIGVMLFIITFAVMLTANRLAAKRQEGIA